MSYYYNYYIGYEDAEGLIYPLGPYDYAKNLCPALCRSRSFASDLYRRFHRIPEKKASDALKEEFKYETWSDEKTSAASSLKVLRVDELPPGSFIKNGYYLIEDVKKYENGEADLEDGLFFDYVSPLVYSSMLNNEILLGRQGSVEFINLADEEDINAEGQELETLRSAADYMFYSYPDYHSEEYEAFVLRTVAESMETQHLFPIGAKIVILETEG